MAKKDLRPQGPTGITYAEPTFIPARDAKRFLWGDEQAGYVSDWIYGSSAKIHMMAFSMNVGARFGNSPDFKTYYNCAETYYCLKGQFTFHCPETGEVHVLEKDDCLYFPPNTWHWGYNFGHEECRIIEGLTPRTTVAVEAYAIKQPWLKSIRYAEDGLIHGHVPGERASKARATLVKKGQAVSEIVGETRPMRVDLVVSTRMLTTGTIDLYKGQQSEAISHLGDKVMYVLEGQVNVHLPDHDGSWWEMRADDTAFIPGNCRHMFFNTSDAPARLLFSVAPEYR